MLRLLFLLLATSIAYSQDSIESIVRNAIKQTEPQAQAQPQAQVIKVTKKANGDIETIYLVPNGSKIAILESDGGGVPDDRAIVKKAPEFVKPQLEPIKIEPTKVPKPRALPPPPRQANSNGTRAPQVAQAFPTTRPTSVQDVGKNSSKNTATIGMALTTTSVMNVARGGDIGLPKSKNDCPD